MKEEPFFGQNIKKTFKVIKGLFKKEEILLACPFCYNELKITDTMHRANKYEDNFEYYVKCSNCKCCGPVGENYTEALQLWSDRKE